MMSSFDLIGFDADDTLWQNEALYVAGRERFRELMNRLGYPPPTDEVVNEVEIHNLPYYGYGVMSFVLSLVETAIIETQGQISGNDLRELIDLGKEMLSAQVEVFEHVEPVLQTLASHSSLLLITKGDLNHQLSKVSQSGLEPYFKSVEIVHAKTQKVYAGILSRWGTSADRFLMVGNSLRSDILPVLEMGGWAVYIPNPLTWTHEQSNVSLENFPRFFQLEDLGQLPDLIARLSRSKE
jgi:putative hydrolase of the HAD superfamily